MFKLYVIISIGLFLDLSTSHCLSECGKNKCILFFKKTLRAKKNVSLGRLEKVFRNGKK